MPLSTDEEKLLVALIDRIIPADEFASASQAGVTNYIRRQLAGDVAPFEPILHDGLSALDHKAREASRKSFADLSNDEQDALCRQIENTPFFQRMIWLTTEGYYANPENGGNVNCVSWKMVGYRGEPT